MSPTRVTPSRLGTLVWMALQAEENRLSSPLDPRAVCPSKWASTEPRLVCAQRGRINSVWWNGHSFNSHKLTRCAHVDQGELGAWTWNLHSCSQHYFCIDEPSRLGVPQLRLPLECIPGLTRKLETPASWFPSCVYHLPSGYESHLQP